MVWRVREDKKLMMLRYQRQLQQCRYAFSGGDSDGCGDIAKLLRRQRLPIISLPAATGLAIQGKEKVPQAPGAQKIHQPTVAEFALPALHTVAVAELHLIGVQQPGQLLALVQLGALQQELQVIETLLPFLLLKWQIGPHQLRERQQHFVHHRGQLHPGLAQLPALLAQLLQRRLQLPYLLLQLLLVMAGQLDFMLELAAFLDQGLLLIIEFFYGLLGLLAGL